MFDIRVAQAENRERKGLRREIKKMPLAAFDESELIKFLVSRDEPVSEAALLKRMTGRRYLSESREGLYKLHFSLYNLLYRFRGRALSKLYYLHLDPMRIRMLHRGQPDECVMYFPEEGRFCSMPAVNGGFCRYHGWNTSDRFRYPVYDPMSEFYLNDENIAFGNSELLERLMRGIMIYSLKKGEIDAALAFFNISHPSRRLIQKRYHVLARQYHPDLLNGNDEMMKRLNSSYQVLREIFIM